MKAYVPRGECMLIFRNAGQNVIEIEGQMIEKLLREDPDIYNYLNHYDDRVLTNEETGEDFGIRIRPNVWLEYVVHKGAPPHWVGGQQKMLRDVESLPRNSGMVMFAEPKATA